jgi:polysaccharide deacetylase family protein (PEP-CTERM system associated)
MLTVDVEDYFQVSAFEHRVPKSQWESIPARVEASTDKLLQTFDDVNVKGTFFILGWVANRFPALIRRICDAGHELASHGYWHQLVYQLQPNEFRNDIRESRQAIADATGVWVDTYRAPSFSITRRSLWALDVLVDEGFKVDSSIFPIRHDRYGIPGAKAEIHSLPTAHGPITEIPPSFWQSPITKVAIGGGYFRLFPISLTSRAIQGVRNSGRPAMFYTHPWEYDPAQPRMENIGIGSRFRHYVGLGQTESKLRLMLQKHTFAPICEVLQILKGSSEKTAPSSAVSKAI